MTYKVGSIEVLQRPSTSVHDPGANYHGFKPSTIILHKGHQKTPADRAFPVDVLFDRDFELKVRDGVILRADIFRPTRDTKVPAILAWSPYGKSGAGFNPINLTPGRFGLPRSSLSGYEKFEAPDPAEWVGRGYGIVNIDVRGSFDSEGDMRYFGKGEAEDGYDVIELLAKLPWCNGKIAMAGNSWLAMSQWGIAALKPPHLACMAPFEGCSDFYRESLCRGGVPWRPFWNYLGRALYGHNQSEDVIAMIDEHPYMNEYWEDKRAKMENIEVPAYILASYSTQLHTVGSFRGFEEISHENKWIRVHGTQEWHDLYKPKTNNELQKFLDRYTKGIDNGWEKTPRVSVTMLNYTKDPTPDLLFSDWPVPETRTQELYFGPSGKLLESKPTTSSTVSYQSDIIAQQNDADEEEVHFSYTFDKKTHVLGYPKVILNVSGEADDMDVFVQLRKASADGTILQNINVPITDLVDIDSEAEVPVITPNIYLGPSGILRASRRAIDESRSKKHWPLHKHTKESEQLLKPGEIVELDIGVWPMGIIFEAGEKLVVKVAGHHMTLAEFGLLYGSFQANNKGKHTVHMGGEYGSRVIIPIVDI